MAGDRVNNYSQVDSNILELQLTTDKTFKGYHQLTLTNYDNTTVPAIAAGSAIECNGALYKFDSEEAISTTDPVTSAAVADGTVYVCVVPGATTCTAAFTATAPTWSDSKQGWYGTGGQANYRYAEYLITKSSTSYGKGFWTQLKSIIILDSQSQHITSSGNVKILFSSVPLDLKSEVSGSTITVKNSGYYNIFGKIQPGTWTSGGLDIDLYHNGVKEYTLGKNSSSAGTQYNAIPFSVIIFLSAGDTIEFYSYSAGTSPDADYYINTVPYINIVQVA
jgi:hypothetical protein